MIEQIEWVACAERLPDDGQAVLMFTTDEASTILVGLHDGEEWEATTVTFGEYPSANGISVTHWAPLPKGPKVE